MSTAERPSGGGLRDEGRGAVLARTRRRARNERLFRWLTGLPVVLAMTLLAALLYDVITDSYSWQVVEPQGSAASFGFLDGFAWFDTWERVVTLELRAGGASDAEIEEILTDPETRRIFAARHRVELMFSVDGRPWRWLVSSSRDDRVLDVPLFEGFRREAELLAGLESGQVLVLNPWLDLSFFAKNASRTPTMAGLAAALVGSLLVIGLVLVIAVPIAIGTAIFLEEYAPETRLARIVEVNLNNLAGVPSIVYGILGLSVFVRGLQLGAVVLAAALTLSLLVVPVIVVAAREALKAVPDTLRQAAYGLGATRWQVVSGTVLPNAVSGITTGVILAVARALGETAPLLLVGAAVFVPRLPDGPLSYYTVLPIQIYGWVGENDVEFTHVASAAIVVLLGVLAILYAAAFLVRRRFRRNW
ncbi:MAG TPA: phosphate ABC transporter permease PstA [Trueperaceae bacterium]|nr:phosphate ABC transporter permease PstA [Trueperaceae bacterium]